MNGWNGSKGTPAVSRTKQKSKGIVGKFTCLVILLLLSTIIACFLISRGKSQTKKETTRSKSEAQIRQNPHRNPRSKIESRSLSDDKIDRTLAEIETNSQLKITPPKIKLVNPFTNRVFHSGVEQKMSLLFTTEVGELPPPIPPLVQEDRDNLAAILISKNEISDLDDERTAECKDLVDYAKKEMREFIKKGGDPDEFFSYYHKELQKAHELREEVLRQLEKIEDEDPTLSRDFIIRANEILKDKGIKTLSVPSEDESDFVDTNKQ